MHSGFTGATCRDDSATTVVSLVPIQGSYLTADGSLEEVVVLTWYVEDAARIELDCLAAGLEDVGLIRPEQARERATWSGRIRERMWDYLTTGDPEHISS